MSERASQLASEMQAGDQDEGDSEKLFFQNFASVPALSKQARKPGEAIQLFHAAKQELESELQASYTHHVGTNYDSGIIPVYHALLALIHWLYPNYAGDNKLKNATVMLKHGLASAASSKSKHSEAYVIGIFVQLRVLPFLIRSKKGSTEQLSKVRQIALSILEEFHNRGPRAEHGLSGLLLDGLGFSYYSLERDKRTSLSFLAKATENLSAMEKEVAKEIKNSNSNLAQIIRAKRVFYQSFAAVAYWDLGICYESQAENVEGEEMLTLVKQSREQYQKAYELARRTPWHIYKGISAYSLAGSYAREGRDQVDRKKAVELLKRSVSIGEESLKWFSLWSPYESDFLGGSWVAAFYQLLADHSEPSVRRKLMARSLKLAKKAEELVNNKKFRMMRYQLVNIGDIFYRNADYHRQIAALQRREARHNADSDTVDLLEKALGNCLKSKSFYREDRYANRAVDASLLAGDICYELMDCHLEDKDKSNYAKLAKRLCNNSVRISKRLGWNERVAESNWRIAQILDREGNFRDGAARYLQAYEAYELAKNSTVQGGRIYQGLAYYMLGWNKIEQAKLAHRASDFENASELYREASDLIAKTKRWQHRSHLFVAESLIERAEKESLAEKTQDSIESFRGAIQALTKLLTEIKTDESDESKAFEQLAHQLTTFCNARIILEKSKEAYRVGDIEQSISGLAQAEVMFEELAESSMISDSLRANELQSLASLCSAMKSFQRAQTSGDPKLYLQAKDIFARAAEDSQSKTLRPLLSGLANFAAFLYYSKQIEESLDTTLNIEKIVECNKSLDYAEVMFRKLGNRSFLNMLKASKHILDATIKMSAAERELESASVKAKLYSQAQRSLSLASKYYQLLGSSRRVKESLRMIGAVRHHKSLIPLAHDIIAEVASNQIIYTAIASSSVFEQTPENSARMLDSAYIELDLEIPKQYISTDENLNLGVTLSNLGKEAAITVKIDEVLPEGFEVVDCAHPISKGQTLTFNMRIEPGASKQITILAKPISQGDFVWHPSLVYLDSSRNYKMTKAQTAKVVVESSKSIDFSSLLAEKQRLESELQVIQAQRDSLQSGSAEETTLTEQIYSLKEKISRIEEDFLRTKNEYGAMLSELERIRQDISALNAQQGDAVRTVNESELEAEEKLLTARIERRRLLLEQAHLL